MLNVLPHLPTQSKSFHSSSPSYFPESRSTDLASSTKAWGFPRVDYRERHQPQTTVGEFQPSQQNIVSQWLDSTTSTSPSGLRTPPGEMNGELGKSMLAPIHGGLYNNVPLSKSARPSYPSEIGTLATNGQPSRFISSRSPSPTHAKDVYNAWGVAARRRSSGNDNQIVSYLQIPPSINDSKGSLAEFAAQITCLFWFESSFTLHRVEESKVTPTPTTPLVPEAKPTMGFRKWVTTILSTTQVTQNVILLALLFIYRLKKLNPTVKGKAGSEFRLLTVALMLGNKFLDDNTYTNKTWADVSGISVQEIHIMEVEFLSNMKYTLYASELEWHAWHQQLGRFWKYFEQASKTPTEPKTQGPYAQILNMAPTLPSPPISLQASPPYGNNLTPGGSQNHLPYMPPYLAPTIPSPAVRMPEVDLRPTGRKRSYDDSSQEPPAKRLARPLGPTSLSTVSPCNNSNPRLPTPNLSISTNGHYNMFPGSSYSAHLPLPTSRPSSISYSSVQLPQSGSMLNLSSQSSGTVSYNSLPPLDYSRRQTSFANSRNTSPTSTATFPAHSSNQLSPSGMPSQRNSPYRPLRGVNTLLVPPPSASMHNPSQNVNFNNMHYQPLGKPFSERKPGVVPYMQPETWPDVALTTRWPTSQQLGAHGHW